MDAPRRAPYGARGLKHNNAGNIDKDTASRSVWGAWIETTSAPEFRRILLVALRMGRVD